MRAYASSLKLWFEFCARRGVMWDRAVVEDVARFVTDLRAPADNVIVLAASASRRAPSTVNRHLGAVFGFYDFHARSGVTLAAGLVTWRRSGRGSYKPFLHHITKRMAGPDPADIVAGAPPDAGDVDRRADRNAADRL